MVVSAAGATDVPTLAPMLRPVLEDPCVSSWIVLLEAEPHLASGGAAWQQACPWIRVLCSRDTYRLARYFGLDPARTVFMDDLPHGVLTLPTGHRLRCLPAHQCPARGAAMLLDEETRWLFTGSLLGSVTLHQRLLGLRAWHEASMPSHRALRDAVRRVVRTEGLDAVAPAFGWAWRWPDLGDALELLHGLSTGLEVVVTPEQVAAARDVVSEFCHLAGVDVHAMTLDDDHFPVLRCEAGVVVGFHVSGGLGLDVLARQALAHLPADRRGQLRRSLLDVERLHRVTIAPARSTTPPARPW